MTSPGRLLVFLLLAVFTAEFLLMLVLWALGPLPRVTAALIDGTLLAACLFPVLWLSVFRAMRELRAEIDERRLTEIRLRSAMEAAEVANRAKSEFLANMSHEIRTPMNGVLGMIDLVTEAELPADTREYLSVARASARSLLRIINDILDFSRMEAGKIQFRREPFDLGELLKEATDALLLSARQKGIVLRARIEPGTPRVLLGDSGRLKQVLLNLVGNAIKFTDRGEVDVRVTPAPQGTHRGENVLLFTVSDTGIGIPEDQQGRLFQSFTQIDGSLARRHGGTGLGLSICREIVERMGGTIRVDSEPGSGSVFSFSVPLDSASGSTAEVSPSPDVLARAPETHRAPPAPPVEAAEARAGEGAAEARLRVLLAEDIPANRLLATALLKKRGWEVVTALNGREAVRAWEDGAFDLVLMDVQMPEMDGFEATRVIREREGTRGGHTPIVAMTAHALEGDRERCLAAGMDAYIPKPVEQREFYDIIARSLRGAPSPPDGPTAAPADLGRARKALGGDEEILQELVRYFLAEHAGQLADLEDAVNSEEPLAIERAAHKLKSAVGHFRAAKAWDLAQALEKMGHEGQVAGSRDLLLQLSREVERIAEHLPRHVDLAEASQDSAHL